MAIKCLSVNARGLGNNIKRRSFFQMFKRNKYGIVCIQEAHVTDKIVDIWKFQWKGELFYSSGTSYGKGQLILFNKKLVATDFE